MIKRVPVPRATHAGQASEIVHADGRELAKKEIILDILPQAGAGAWCRARWVVATTHPQARPEPFNAQGINPWGFSGSGHGSLLRKKLHGLKS